jgi:hypothetical protein
MALDDFTLSPHTGWTRQHWAAQADRMLLALRPYASPGHPRIDLPGPPSAYGRDSDSLEAFARAFLLAAIRLRGEAGADPHDLAGWYAAGLRAGTDPASPSAWPRPDKLGQAKVEACSIALGLHLTRPWLWDRLPAADRERIVSWLGTVVGEQYPPINWVWFQIVVETFLRSVDGPWSRDDIDAGLAVHESLYRADGWYADGPERAYDHYGGWALHAYPLLWADMAGDLCPAALRDAWRERLSLFLDDAARLVGADGSPLLQGRSLTYRFAAAAPFWVGAMTGATTLTPGLLRRACSGIVRHFARHGAPDDRGLLTQGWHGEWPAISQAYTGPGSPYWAAKGMLGLALPADHPVWTAVKEPLPVERGDFVRALAVPGWLVSGTRRDGLVRVVNHGTDHSVPGDPRADSPLYARLGYSTGTLPPLSASAAADPLDNAVTIVDRDGRGAHRNGFELLGCSAEGDVATAVSRATLHWVDTAADTGPDHGSGRSGPVRPGPVVTLASVVRGPVEVRLARLDTADGLAGDTVLEISGWPVAGDPAPAASAGEALGCAVVGGGLTSDLAGPGDFAATVRRLTGASPLGGHVAVPVVRSVGPPRPGVVYACVVRLGGADIDEPVPVITVAAGDVVTVAWPDGAATTIELPAP